MPVYKNISNASLILPRENGLKPDLELSINEIFNGSENFYNKYVTEKLIKRTTDGWPYYGAITSGPDVLTVSVDGFIQIEEDGIKASTYDASVNTCITANTVYSAFGKIYWTEGEVNYEACFAITGNGTHGADSMFDISANSNPIGAVSIPIVADSKIDIHSGTIVFSLNGNTMENAIVEVIYNTSQEGYRLGVYKNELLNTPLFSTVQSVTADNQITYKKIFYTGSKAGDPAKLITMSYTGTQTEPDAIKEELSTVTESNIEKLNDII